MSLFQRIQDDLRTALKAGDTFTLGVLRLLNAALHNKAIERRGKGQSEELAHEEVIGVLAREFKKRQEAAELYKKGGREDLAQKENQEAALIQKYLPAQLSRGEIEKKIDEVMATLRQAEGGVPLNLGAVMRVAMAELKGRADAGAVSEIVRAKLG